MSEELKTLKDLDDYGMMVVETFKNELKDEAIKWIKEYIDKELSNLDEETDFFNGLIGAKAWIINFFNLTSEGLK